LSSHQIVIDPCISLLGVNHSEVLSKYLRGEYSNIFQINRKIKLNANCGDGVISASYGQSPTLDIFSFNSRSGSDFVFVTNNNIQFKRVHLEGKQGSGGKCDYCDLYYDSGMDGIPFLITSEFVDGKVVPVITTIGLVCDYRCALTEVLRRGGGNNRNNYTCNSESWLKCMFSLQYPNSGDLLPAPDKKHLIQNGGTCTPEQYKSTRYRFTPTTLFITGPGKECFHKQITPK